MSDEQQAYEALALRGVAEQAVAAHQRRLSGGGGRLSSIIIEAIYRLAQLDRLHNQGRAVGLSKPETNEVIYAWIAWYQTTPWPVDFEIIGKALTVRALGEDWTPPLGGGNR